MSVRKSLFLFLCALVLTAGGLLAQQPAAAKQQDTKQQTTADAAAAAAKSAVPAGGVPRYIKPETAEQRATRLGTSKDPGLDPDPQEVFERNGKKYTIMKAEKRYAKYLPQAGWVRPFANANFSNEIYQENDKYVWVWNEVVDMDAAMQRALAEDKPWSDDDVAYFAKLASEFEPLEAEAASVRIQFSESSTGLPTTGSWRNGGTVADMNEDGLPDLVLPPQRGPAGAPAIFLGDGKGGWTRWKIEWPRLFNYGTVVAADFNKDKHLDLAFSIHLTGVAVFMGNGKGKFTEIGDGLDRHFPTRRMIVSDVDADGWLDIVAISEGPIGRGQDARAKMHGNLRAYMNRKKGQEWEGVNLAEPKEYLGGDYVSAGTFNGDKYPDFIGASVYFNSVFTLYNSKGSLDYEPLLDGVVIPGRSYYQATTAGKFVRGAKTDDAIVSYGRFWPKNLNAELVPAPPLDEVSGIDRLTFVGGQAKRTSIVRWKGARPVRGMANGDFDGDGNLDVACVVAESNNLMILLGDGKGGFRSAEVTGIELPPQRTYDLIVTDLNRDKRPDVVVMFEAKQATVTAAKNGSVRVYLNRGAQVP